jgi:hypothetical protein
MLANSEIAQCADDEPLTKVPLRMKKRREKTCSSRDAMRYVSEDSPEGIEGRSSGTVEI